MTSSPTNQMTSTLSPASAPCIMALRMWYGKEGRLLHAEMIEVLVQRDEATARILEFASGMIPKHNVERQSTATDLLSHGHVVLVSRDQRDLVPVRLHERV